MLLKPFLEVLQNIVFLYAIPDSSSASDDASLSNCSAKKVGFGTIHLSHSRNILNALNSTPVFLCTLVSPVGRSKPEKPPSQPQAEVTTQEDDDNKDLQAALRESLKAPSSPQPESGAQSSTPKPLVDLDKRETEFMAQLDRLMEESVRLESLPNPTVRDRSRIRSVATVLDEVEKEIQEINAQKQAQSSKGSAKAQEAKALQVAPDVSSQVSRVSTTQIQVQPVVPPTMQPLTLDNLMAGTMQPAKSPPTPAVSPRGI